MVERRAVASQPFAPMGFEPRKYFAVGDAAAVITRCQEYLGAGVHKFVLMPTAQGDEAITEHTRRPIAEVVPVVQADLSD